MASNRERESGVGYPKLTKEQIDTVIDNLIWVCAQRNLGRNLDTVEETITALVGFYTRRWGLPPSVGGRVQAVRELAAARDVTS